MPEQEIEEGLIQEPMERVIYQRWYLLMYIGILAIFVLIICGILYIDKVFSEKIWI